MTNITDKTISRGGASTGDLRDFSECGAPRRGFGKLNLIVALAVFALVSLLAGIQAGDINPAAFLPAGKSTKNSKSVKTPQFLQPAQAQATEETGAEGEPQVAAADAALVEIALADPAQITADSHSRLLAFKAFGLMDPMLAAERLQSLSDTDATMILATQKRRDLAYILEMADPDRAAVWVSLLLQADGRLPLLAPGESVLDQINSGLNPAAESVGTEDPTAESDPALDPAASVETVGLLPDYMLSPAERRAFLAEFPQYQTDRANGTDITSIPVIADFSVSD